MHAAENPKVYTRMVGARVRPETAEAIEEAAKAAGVKSAEWIRGVIEREVRSDSNTRTVLAEIMALRAILLTLHTEEWRDVAYKNEDLKAMVAKAGARKFAAADRVMLEAKQG